MNKAVKLRKARVLLKRGKLTKKEIAGKLKLKESEI
jgi:hypothetical protein